MNRRQFVFVSALASTSLLHSAGRGEKTKGIVLTPEGTLGGLRQDGTQTPLEGATWYVADNIGDGFSYKFPAGTLAKAAYLTSDMLYDGNHNIVFLLSLQEGENGRRFTFHFSGLNQCSFRVRMPLSLVNQNAWGIARDGAYLKPRCAGDRVDPAKVDRMTLAILRKSPKRARWCMTPFMVSDWEVEKITRPILPKGPLLDEMGQSTIHDWPAKTRSVDEVVARIRRQLEDAPGQKWPDQWSRWGGCRAKRLEQGTGFFRTHHDGKRWWLVDPDGCAFWSIGLNEVCVDTAAYFQGLETALKWIPDPQGEFADAYLYSLFYPQSFGRIERPAQRRSVNYLAANFIRALGAQGWHDKWAQIAIAEMRRLRFNSIGNVSNWQIAVKPQFPYTRPMWFRPSRVINVYRDFPDIYHPDFEKDAADYASTLRDTANDPAFLGYFVMNEPSWGFSTEVPAAGMLFVTPSAATRSELAAFLKRKYPDDAALSRAWTIKTTFDQIASGPWTTVLPQPALVDLEAFSSKMVEKYYTTLRAACKAVDPNHLNLGMRWAGPPPKWAAAGMKGAFDVYSFNCYREKVPADMTTEIQATLNMPTLIGEWHFGALDAGLPSSGIGHLKNQQDRAKAYRLYLEDAAANPNCVGAHWFTIYDESALGRGDGENYNIGFFDVCHRPYDELSAGAITSHERLYDVVAGKVAAFNDPVEYLPLLY